jgi:hypothetical protein
VRKGQVREADHPPVVRWRDLPEAQAALAQTGFDAWRTGELDAAEQALDALRLEAEAVGCRDGRFHARHLLACVAFSRADYEGCRSLHEEVLRMCEDIGFLGGLGSSRFDLGMVDEAEGEVGEARRQYEAARAGFVAGGYDGHLAVVDAALTRLAGAGER